MGCYIGINSSSCQGTTLAGVENEKRPCNPGWHWLMLHALFRIGEEGTGAPGDHLLLYFNGLNQHSYLRNGRWQERCDSLKQGFYMLNVGTLLGGNYNGK